MPGESIQTDRERYGLNWAGKSVNFDTTENLIIEGDNLEVLKLLQKSYFGKVQDERPHGSTALMRRLSRYVADSDGPAELCPQ